MYNFGLLVFFQVFFLASQGIVIAMLNVQVTAPPRTGTTSGLSCCAVLCTAEGSNLLYFALKSEPRSGIFIYVYYLFI